MPFVRTLWLIAIVTPFAFYATAHATPDVVLSGDERILGCESAPELQQLGHESIPHCTSVAFMTDSTTCECTSQIVLNEVPCVGQSDPYWHALAKRVFSEMSGIKTTITADNTHFSAAFATPTGTTLSPMRYGEIAWSYADPKRLWLTTSMSPCSDTSPDAHQYSAAYAADDELLRVFLRGFLSDHRAACLASPMWLDKPRP